MSGRDRYRKAMLASVGPPRAYVIAYPPHGSTEYEHGDDRNHGHHHGAASGNRLDRGTDGQQIRRPNRRAHRAGNNESGHRKTRRPGGERDRYTPAGHHASHHDNTRSDTFQ